VYLTGPLYIRLILSDRIDTINHAYGDDGDGDG
jgi:hypothetical protein